jgi:spermidine synthase
VKPARTVTPNPTPVPRLYLYFTAAITGAAVLVVEILGAKVLAPWLGTSHFVWTAQISVTLLALAAGYYIGGRMVDASPRLDRLYLCLAAAALILCIGVLICGPVASACLQFSLPVATLLTSFVLYFLPLTFLAITGPFVTRVLTHSTASVGGQIGKLSAVSTIGSVIGAILISYLLIPYFSNSVTMFATAGALFVLAISYFIAFRRPVTGVVALSIAGLSVGAIALSKQPHFKNATELYFHNSSFGQMQVVDFKDGSRRFYLNDYLVQNTFDPATRQSVSMFTYMLHGLARTYRTNIHQVLCLGLGVGIVPMNFAREGAQVDVVEINSGVIPLAEKYFGLEPAKLNITIGDARYFLNRTIKKYDAIILDTFLGDSSPSHLMTREAFASIRNALAANGVLVINSFGDFTPGNDFMVASLDKTLQAVFKSVRIHAASSANGNVFFVASDNPALTLSARLDPEIIPESVRSLVLDAFDSNRGTDDRSGRVLTDDYNPVDYFDAKNREENRRRLALSISGL